MDHPPTCWPGTGSGGSRGAENFSKPVRSFTMLKKPSGCSGLYYIVDEDNNQLAVGRKQKQDFMGSYLVDLVSPNQVPIIRLSCEYHLLHRDKLTIEAPPGEIIGIAKLSTARVEIQSASGQHVLTIKSTDLFSTNEYKIKERATNTIIGQLKLKEVCMEPLTIIATFCKDVDAKSRALVLGSMFLVKDDHIRRKSAHKNHHYQD